MRLITLTTDMGLKDHYVASVKGAIYGMFPEARVVDITHDIDKFNVVQAAFVLGSAYRDFPKGSIHIISVNPQATAESPHMAVYADGHYFIGADNGLFWLIFDKVPDKIVELTIKGSDDLINFPTKSIFAQAAVHLARGGSMDLIGGPRDSLKRSDMYRPVVDGNAIRGLVLYEDSYGNLFTNITKNLFSKAGKGRPFTIFFREQQYRIKRISKSYLDVDAGELLAIFSAYNFLQISINQGKANELLGLEFGSIVRIEFQ